MDTASSVSPHESDDSAINQVLEAECAARESIAGARTEAAELIAAAREKARRIHERADVRATRLCAATERRIAQRTAELQSASANLQHAPLEQDQCYGRLAAAVARLAATLSGGSP